MKNLILAAALIAIPLLGFAQDNTFTSASLLAHSGAPANGTSEVDTITIGGTPTGGTFTITVAGSRTTDPITWTATDATLVSRIDAALEKLSIIGTGGVTTAAGTVSSGIGTITLTFTGKNAVQDFPALTATSSLTGTSPTVSIATTTPGVAASWANAPTGQVVVDSTNGALYQNTSTTAGAPTWSVFTGVSIVSSAALASLLSDESGTGLVVFNTTPTLVTPVLGSATGTSLTVTGALKSTGPTGSGIGYATGAGGAVTQITSRATGVTLSKLSGQITTDTTSLAAAAFADFIVTNTTVAATDTIVASIVPGGTGSPRVNVVNVASGSFTLRITNDHAATADTSADKVNFAVLKAVAN